VTGLVKLAAVEWYCGKKGHVQANCPTLAVVFDNGRAQLMRHELDDSEWVCTPVFQNLATKKVLPLFTFVQLQDIGMPWYIYICT
jgi:hypothetical protein